MKKISVLLLGIILLISAGCAAPEQEEIMASDLTIEELESRMKKAMDPNGRFARARTYVMRQQVVTERGWLETPIVQMVEVKFRQPDQFKLTTYTDNEAELSIIANGSAGWMVDLKREKVVKLDKEGLERVLVMVRLTNPGNRLKNVFESVSLDRCRLDGENYYRFTCRNKDRNPMYIYVGEKDYFNKRLRMDLEVGKSSIKYDSKMQGYSMYEGVMIPDESLVIQGNTAQKSKVIYYKLDENLSDEEFRPPLF